MKVLFSFYLKFGLWTLVFLVPCFASEDDSPNDFPTSNLMETLFDQLDDRFKEDFHRALEQMERDRKHVEQLLGDDMMMRFYQHIEDLAKDFEIEIDKLNSQDEFEWKDLSEGGRSLVFRIKKSKASNLNIEIADQKLTLKYEYSESEGVSHHKSYTVEIPSNLDSTTPRYDQEEEKLVIFFPYR